MEFGEFKDSVGNVNKSAVFAKTVGLYGPVSSVAVSAKIGSTVESCVLDLENAGVKAWLGKFLSDTNVVTYNSYYQSHLMKRDFGVPVVSCFDVMLTARAGGHEDHSIESLARSILKVSSPEEVSDDVLSEWCSKVTLMLSSAMKDTISSSISLIEAQAASILGQQSCFGLRVDSHKLAGLCDVMGRERKDLDDMVSRIAKSKGVEGYKTSSRDKVAVLLFDKLGLKCREFTGTGKRSTSQEALAHVQDNEVVSAILRIRSIDSTVRMLAKCNGPLVNPVWSTVQPRGVLDVYAKEPSLTSFNDKVLDCFPPRYDSSVWVGINTVNAILPMLAAQSGEEGLLESSSEEDQEAIVSVAFSGDFESIQEVLKKFPKLRDFLECKVRQSVEESKVVSVGGFVRDVSHVQSEEEKSKRGIRSFVLNSMATLKKLMLIKAYGAAVDNMIQMQGSVILPSGVAWSVPSSRVDVFKDMWFPLGSGGKFDGIKEYKSLGEMARDCKWK